MSYGSRMVRKGESAKHEKRESAKMERREKREKTEIDERGGEDQMEHETTESGGRDRQKLEKDNGMSPKVKPAKPNLVYQEGAVTRTVEPFQKSRNKNEFGY